MRVIFVLGLIFALAAVALANPAPESKKAAPPSSADLYLLGLEQLRKLGIHDDEIGLLQSDIPNPDTPFDTPQDVIAYFKSRSYLKKESLDKLIDLYQKTTLENDGKD